MGREPLFLIPFVLLGATAQGHVCGPPVVPLSAGQEAPWTIIADVTEVSTIYTPRTGPGGSFGDPAVATLFPDFQFEAKDGEFTITAVGAGATSFTYDWFNNVGPGGSGSCTVTVLVTGLGPPIAMCHDVVVEARDDCTAAVSPQDVDDGSRDPGGGPLTLSLFPSGPFPLGTTQVALSVRDGAGRTASCSAKVTVEDRRPPEITTPPEVTLAAEDGCGHFGLLDTITVRDACTPRGSLRIESDAPSTLPIGATLVRWTVTDESGNQATSSQIVTVVDAPLLGEIPEDILVPCDGRDGAEVQFRVPAAWEACSGRSVPVLASMAPGDRFPLGLTTVLLEAIDQDGRAAFASFAVIVTCGIGGGQVPGDLGIDGITDLSDVIAILGFLYLDVPLGAPCDPGLAFPHVADWNGDGAVDIGDPLAMLFFFFSGGSPHSLGAACQAFPGCAGTCAPVFLSRVPAPRIVMNEPFSGRIIAVEEAGGVFQDILAVRLTVRGEEGPVSIGSHFGGDLDAAEPSGRWTFPFDAAAFPSGPYRLKAEMFQEDGGYGMEERLVTVAPPPVGRVVLLAGVNGARVLSAEGFGEVGHSFSFESGQTSSQPTMEIPAGDDPRIFAHTARSSLGAESSDVYLLDGDSLFSLEDLEAPAALAEWSAALLDVATEKEGVLPGFSAENRARVESAIEKLRVAAERILAARAKLAEVPPDMAGAKALLEDAARLVREAMAHLEEVDQQVELMRENIEKLQLLDGAGNLPLAPGGERGDRPARNEVGIELSHLADRILQADAIIKEKKELTGLTDEEKDIRNAIVLLLEAARPLLEEARRALNGAPRDLARAEAKIREARELVRQAGEKINRFVPGGLGDNRRRLEDLFVKLCLLEGRIWLHRQLGDDNDFTGNGDKGIGLPKVSRDLGNDPVSFYRSSTATIHVHAGDGLSADTVFHELDHHFLEKKVGDSSPGGRHEFDVDQRQQPGTEKRDSDQATRLAFSEGWADYSSAAKQGTPTYLGWNLETLNRKDAQGNDEGMRNSGPTVEGSVAGVLWDLQDGGPQDDDSVQVPFALIWKALCGKDREGAPKTIGQFRRRLLGVLGANGYDDAFQDKVDKLFCQHGVFSDQPR